MKPLHAVPLTREDRLIWLQINLPLGKPTPKHMTLDGYRAQDRRDAELMWWAQVEKNSLGYHALEHGPCVVNVRGGGGVVDRDGAFA